MVRNGVVFSLILVSIIVTAGCVDAYGGLTADEVVNRTLAKYEATDDMAGEVTITTVFSGAEYLEFKDYILKKPAKFKLTEFESGSETISDGEDVWTLDLVNNAVTGHFSPHSVEVPDCDYGRILQEIVRFYRLELEGTETQSDRLCYVIQAVPEDNSFLPIRTIWIDKEQRTPVKIKSDYGYYQSLIQYENFSHDIGFDDDYFAISLPFRAINGSTSSVMYDLIPFDKAQENVNFSILVPSYTSNYLFVGASLPQNNASDCVTLFYTNGSRSLIITQTVSGVEQPSNTDTSVTLTYGDGEIVEKFGGNVILKVNCNQVEVAIIGQLDKEEIIKIAESLGCA